MIKLLQKIIERLEYYIQINNKKFIKSKFNLPTSVQIKYGRLNMNGNIMVGEHCKFLGDITIHANSLLKIGRFTAINGPNTDIYCTKNDVIIGSFCSIARNVSIQEYNHDITNFTTFFIEKNLMGRKNSSIDSRGAIEIGNDVWIGAQCVILSGAKIGTGSVIAANSVVTGEIPPYAIAAGSPAKVLKYRFSKDKINYLLKSKWWEKINKNNYEQYAQMFNNYPNF